MPGEAAATSSTTTAATVPSALLPSHRERRGKGACLARAEVLVAPRRAVVVEVALTWSRCFRFLKGKELSFLSLSKSEEKRKAQGRRLLAASQFSESSNRPNSLTNRASSLVSNLAKDDLDLKKKEKACNDVKGNEKR